MILFYNEETVLRSLQRVCHLGEGAWGGGGGGSGLLIMSDVSRNGSGARKFRCHTSCSSRKKTARVLIYHLNAFFLSLPLSTPLHFTRLLFHGLLSLQFFTGQQ